MSRQPIIHGCSDLASHLRYSILEGEWNPGEKLPGEVEISQQYHLNRHTVRAAFAELEQEGLIYRVQGKGTFVSLQKIPYTISPGTSFSTALEKLGLQGQPELLHMTQVQASGEVARTLKLGSKALVWEMKIVRTIESFPVCLTTSWLSVDRFPALDEHFPPFRSLYNVLRQKEGVGSIQRKWSHIEAALPTPTERDHLDCSPQLPLVITRSLACDEQGTPLEVSHSRARSDAYSLEVNFSS